MTDGTTRVEDEDIVTTWREDAKGPARRPPWPTLRTPDGTDTADSTDGDGTDGTDGDSGGDADGSDGDGTDGTDGDSVDQ